MCALCLLSGAKSSLFPIARRFQASPSEGLSTRPVISLSVATVTFPSDHIIRVNFFPKENKVEYEFSSEGYQRQLKKRLSKLASFIMKTKVDKEPSKRRAIKPIFVMTKVFLLLSH